MVCVCYQQFFLGLEVFGLVDDGQVGIELLGSEYGKNVVGVIRQGRNQCICLGDIGFYQYFIMGGIIFQVENVVFVFLQFFDFVWVIFNDYKIYIVFVEM